LSFVVNSVEAKPALCNAWPNLVMTTNSTIRYFADTIAPEQLFRLKYAQNRFSAGDSPQTPLGELTVLPRSLAGSGVGPPRKGGEGKGREVREREDGR